MPGALYSMLYARAFQMDRDELFADDIQATEITNSAPRENDREGMDSTRRSLLMGGLASLTFPALGLDELRHISAMLLDAHRYTDRDIVHYFGRQLEFCADRDGRFGPRQTLPIVLGLLAAVERSGTEAKSNIRREVFGIGAQVAEFAGWLYRDMAMLEQASYWHDRAIEWAQVSGNLAMQGYVLLKKSQVAWDDRNAIRMITLAEAVQDGPWRIPVRVRAEAIQQEARAQAMLSGKADLIDRKIDLAREMLENAKHDSQRSTAKISPHYDDALFAAQVAICYTEAGRYQQARSLYDEWLSEDTFSRRDYGYFLSLKAGTCAALQEPDEASGLGIKALALARETGSVRTAREVSRLVGMLDRWRTRESVQELRSIAGS
ncbi:hypothetical protein GCM10010404_66770 [Nonomuraea africana]